MNTYLQRILQRKHEEIEEMKEAVSSEQLMKTAQTLPPPRSLRESLAAGEGIALIAEIKRASPSKGWIRQDLDIEDWAQRYERSRASAISVLTDRDFFGGNLEFLRSVKSLTTKPVLRKDFIVDEYQVLESRANGADAILLIVAALTDEELVRFHRLATELQMDCLVEAHDAAEVTRALDAEATLIGVNNRDLNTFQVDLNVSLRLHSLLPSGVVMVSESGIDRREHVEALENAGVHAILVGETLMRSDDPAAKIDDLLGHTRGGGDHVETRE